MSFPSLTHERTFWHCPAVSAAPAQPLFYSDYCNWDAQEMEMDDLHLDMWEEGNVMEVERNGI